MALLGIRDLRERLALNQRLIGLDPGSRTIGVALSDVGLSLASPYGSLRRRRLRDNAAEFLAIAQKEDAGGIVVGLPLSMDGSLGPAAQAAARLGAGAVRGDRPANGIVGRAAILGRQSIGFSSSRRISAEGSGQQRWTAPLLPGCCKAHWTRYAPAPDCQASAASEMSACNTLPFVSGPSSNATTKTSAPATVPTSMGMAKPDGCPAANAASTGATRPPQTAPW